MSLAVVRSRAQCSASAPEVTVEVHLANGLPSFSIVGLPDTEVRESRERVRSALQNCRLEFPVRRITVNLAPADLPKESGRFDLPIALGILAASGQIPAAALEHREFAGELSLSGALRPMRGAFAMACGAARASSSIGSSSHAQRALQLFLPLANAAEAALVPGVTVFGVPDLLALCAHLNDTPAGRLAPTPADHDLNGSPAAGAGTVLDAAPDLADVIGQHAARRALEVAAAGAHHMLMIGPPGAGKSMLAARLPGLLPPMSDEDALVSAALLSGSTQGFVPRQWRQRPFRAPHHSASAAALIGGRNPPQPGEITLAHLGVLFLDELPEFNRHVLEMLREPLEVGRITISRAAHQADFPAACQLIAAMNPCPCGWHGDAAGRCRCTPDAVSRYRHKLSGPLLDRIDIQLEVPALPPEQLMPQASGGAYGRAAPRAESSAVIAVRVAAARERQMQRQNTSNAQLASRDIDALCQPDAAGMALLREAGRRFGWSGRAYHRVLKVTRTIADLAGATMPAAEHVAEAIQYRRALGPHDVR